jgi:hypothetical protein
MTVHLPGSVVLSAIQASRIPIQSKGYANGYLQTDDGVIFSSNETNGDAEIATIGGKPFDSAATYAVAVLDLLLDGLEHIEPLEQWYKSNVDALLLRSRDDALGLKELCIAFFARLWWRLLPPFADLDKDKDGTITSEELGSALEYVLKGHFHDDDGSAGRDNWAPDEVMAADKVVAALFGMCDTNSDGMISPAEYNAVVGGPARSTMTQFEGIVAEYRKLNGGVKKATL